MFEYLAPFSKIFVTGPQRSGTMLVSASIANDLDYYFYPEEQIRVWEWWRVERLWGRTSNFVLQAPALCHRAHELTYLDTVVVLVRRNIDEIIASERRIGWDGEARELRRYGLKEGIISKVKYDYWERVQSPLIPIERRFEVEYESLAEHELWIAPEERPYFGHA